jgi:ribosomal protein S21
MSSNSTEGRESSVTASPKLTATAGNNTNGGHLQVFVRDNNVDQALRILKKKMQREGVSVGLARRQKRSGEHASLRGKEPNEKV